MSDIIIIRTSRTYRTQPGHRLIEGMKAKEQIILLWVRDCASFAHVR